MHYSKIYSEEIAYEKIYNMSVKVHIVWNKMKNTGHKEKKSTRSTTGRGMCSVKTNNKTLGIYYDALITRGEFL